ncbi:hypothetical protein [Methylomonas sp. MK1]|uniref:hypothetical protein n=1 Tax=Methylomonas sp. MK1 TaxID=1131552 RepID=UPI001360B45C|nr:hypothetical protein [Methylomonas sp. MK1]
MRPRSLLLAAITAMVLSACATALQSTQQVPAAWPDSHAANRSLLGKINCRANLHPVIC